VVCLPNFHTKSALRCSACFSPSAHPNPILAHPIPIRTHAHSPAAAFPADCLACPCKYSLRGAQPLLLTH
jgi:hypothetical protein